MTSFEQVLKEINDFGRYQKSRLFLLCLAALLPGIVTYIHSFAAANPDHRCQNPYDSNDTFSVKESDYKNLVNITSLDKCSITYQTNYNTTATEKCNKWVYDRQYYETTLTEDWSMVCDRAFMRGSVQTVYFMGYLIGSIVMGILADNYGRRPIMLSAFVMMIAGSVGVTFGPQISLGITGSYVIYAISRFLIACGTRGINVTGFVLGMEMMANEKRKLAGLMFPTFYGLGQLVLVVMAYLARDWQTLSLINIFLTLPFISYFFVLPESPRWLLSNKRNDDALKIVEKVSKVNKTSLNIDTWNDFLETETMKKGDSKKESIVDAMKSPKMVLISLVLYLNWIINNFVFYGVGLKANDLGVSPYLSFTIAGVVEVVALGITFLILDKTGRKSLYCGFLFLAGVSCISIIFVEKLEYELALAMFGKFCASGSYAIIYLYSSELFPTSIRNSLMGSCSMMARVGSMMAPLVLDMGDWTDLPFLIFGVSGVIGAISAVILPETLNRPLPECIKDCEKTSSLGFSFRYQPPKRQGTESEKMELKN